jgi:hypothetical protein
MSCWRDKIRFKLPLHGLKAALELHEDGAYYNKLERQLYQLLVDDEWQTIHCMYVGDEDVEIRLINGMLRSYPLDHMFDCRAYYNNRANDPIKLVAFPNGIISLSLLTRGELGRSYVSPKHSIILYDNMIIERALVDERITFISTNGEHKVYEPFDVMRSLMHFTM